MQKEPSQISPVDFTRVDEMNVRAWEMRQTSAPEAHSLAEAALLQAEGIHYLKGKAEALITLGWCSYLSDRYTEAMEQSEKGLAISEEIQETRLCARACNNIGNIYLQTSNYTKALEYLANALSMAQKTDDRHSIAASCNNLGLVYRNIGEYDKALEYFTEALVKFKEIGYKRDIAIALMNIGNVYRNTADYSKALGYYLKALNIHEESAYKKGMANVLNSIGLVYHSFSEFNKAHVYYKRALAIREEIRDARGIANTLNNIANVYNEDAFYDESIKYHKRSLAIQEEIGNPRGVANSLSNIGIVYRRMGHYDTALEYFRRSLVIEKDISNEMGIASVFKNIGMIYTTKEFSGYNSGQGIEKLLEALSISGKINAKDLLYSLHEELATAYADLGDMTKAYEHHKRFHDIKEVVYNEESARRIQNLDQQRKIAEVERERELEKQRLKVTDQILKRILPDEVAERIKQGETNIAQKFSSASVLFADIVGFTPLAEKMGAEEVVKLLSGIFSHFDGLCEIFGVEKIKTIGDSYMVASGVPVKCEDHLIKIAKLALAMQEDIKANVGFTQPELSIRIGIHTGEVIAGVLGTQKLSYDIWGDTVNTAARMESTGEPNMIHCSEQVFKALEDKFVFKERGEIDIKGKGTMKTYFLISQL